MSQVAKNNANVNEWTAANWDVIAKLERERFIRVKQHPNKKWTLYNYSQRAQMSKNWPEELKACRGLVVDSNKNVVGWPFAKFFNSNEGNSASLKWKDDAPVCATEKMDGSMIEVVQTKEDGLLVCTRGDFFSPHAQAARKMLETTYSEQVKQLKVGHTYIFELIDSAYRIVVNYGDRKELVLLAVRDHASGALLPPSDFASGGDADEKSTPAFPVVPSIAVKTWKDAKEWFAAQDKIQRDASREGIVVANLATGERVKLKFTAYKRFHSALSHVCTKSIWTILASGTSYKDSDFAELVPDEALAWVMRKEKELIQKRDDMWDEMVRLKAQLPGERGDPSWKRKAADWIRETQPAHLHKRLMYFLNDKLDDAQIRLRLWQELKPSQEQNEMWDGCILDDDG